MHPFNSLFNHVSSLTANAVQTLTHGFHTEFSGFRDRKTTSVPAKFFLGNPSLLTAGGGYPNLGFTFSVNDRKNPLSFKTDDFAVRDQFGAQRVNHFDMFATQNKFRSNPDQVRERSQENADANVSNYLRGISAYPDAIRSKKSDQTKSAEGPSKISSGSKSFVHLPSIAGERK